MQQIDLRRHQELENLLFKYGGILQNYDGVIDVGIGFITKDNTITEELGLIVYVGHKKDESYLDPDELLPKSIEGVRIDVVEADPQPEDGPYDPVELIVGGINIANSRLRALGTLGCVVFDSSTNEPLGLSNWHILKKHRGRAGDVVVQPGNKNRNSGFDIGKVLRWNKQLDCAVFRIEGRQLDSTKSLLGMAGRISGVSKPIPGMSVKKAGARTSVTHGQIQSVNLNSIVIVPNEAKPAANNEISRGGDSGAVWVTDDESLNAVALHHSGDKANTPHTEKAWANSIEKIAAILKFRF